MTNVVLQTFNLLGGLALFLFGMKQMSDGLQKLAGDKMRAILARAAANRFSATACGTLITAIIQSSSATTVMVVGFTSAGLLTLHQALGVIFGANIGTTLTAWIVSLFGFNVDISLFALPVISLGFFMQFAGKWPVFKRTGETLFGFGLLFFGLAVMKQAIPTDITSHPQLLALLAKLRPDTLLHLLALIFGGTLLTIILQSSSAVMAMTLTCAAAGLINFPTACALVLGENIGTTVTANLAALGAGKTARRAALGHTLFNVFGVLWAILFFPQLIELVDRLVAGDPNITPTKTLTSVLPYHIAAFHTLFNLINTAIMLPLLKPLARLTYLFIPYSKREENKAHNLVYLSSRFTPTPEIAFIAVRKETERMLHIVSLMLDKLNHALKTKDKSLFERLIEDVKKGEQTTDILEHKISVYLTALTHENLSRHAVAEAVNLLDVVSSVERMGDCGEKTGRILEKFHGQHVFSPQDEQDLLQMIKLTKQIIKRTRIILLDTTLVSHPLQKQEIFEAAVTDEKTLNLLRKQFLHDRRNRLLATQKPAEPNSITAYADLLNNFERMGDFALRINEHILGLKAGDEQTTVHLSHTGEGK